MKDIDDVVSELEGISHELRWYTNATFADRLLKQLESIDEALNRINTTLENMGATLDSIDSNTSQ